MNTKKSDNLPGFFRPILWSYDFESLRPSTHKKTVIINTINYGDFKHWRWLIDYYGKNEIKEILRKLPATEIKLRARRLAGVIFNIKTFNHALRVANK